MNHHSFKLYLLFLFLFLVHFYTQLCKSAFILNLDFLKGIF